MVALVPSQRGPAVESTGVGVVVTVTLCEAGEDGQAPLEIVQVYVYVLVGVPPASPVTPEVGEEAVVMLEAGPAV
jgi:hypothetical protein